MDDLVIKILKFVQWLNLIIKLPMKLILVRVSISHVQNKNEKSVKKKGTISSVK